MTNELIADGIYRVSGMETSLKNGAWVSDAGTYLVTNQTKLADIPDARPGDIAFTAGYGHIWQLDVDSTTWVELPKTAAGTAATQAAASATAAAGSASAAATSASQAQTVADSIPADYTSLSNSVDDLKSAKEDSIGTYTKADLQPEAYGYNIVDNKNSSQSTFYHYTYQIPSGTKLVGVSGYHATEKQALWGFYDSNNTLISYEKDSASAVNYPDMVVIAVPDNAAKLIVNVGTNTNRGIFLFTKYDVISEDENRVNYAESQSLTDTQKAQARTNIGAVSADDVEFALEDKQDIIGTFVKADITPTAYGYNIVENKNSSQASFYHVVYEIPEGTVVIGVNGYHATEKQALYGFYNSNDELIDYEQDSRSAINYPDVITVHVPENASKLIVNIGTYTSRGVHVFTQMDVSKEITETEARTEVLEKKPLSVFPVVFPPSAPYVYDGADITTDFINGTGDMLTPYYALFDGLVANYGNHISRDQDVGMDESNTYAIRSYTIGQFSSTSNKPVILWLAGIHASEPYTLTATYAMCKELLENHDTDEVLGFIWRNCALKVVPVCNPWGLANGGQRYNSGEVNLNRDFPVDWQYSSDQYDKTGDTYASQAETQALMSYINANSNALFVVTKHDSDYYTDASGKIAYSVDNFKTDMNVLRANYAQMHMLLLKKYSWIKANRSSTDYTNLFNNLSTNATHGSMNKWFNSIGVHGCLLEVTRPKSGDYTADKQQDFIQINLELSVNMLASILQQNALLQANNEVWNQYS